MRWESNAIKTDVRFLIKLYLSQKFKHDEREEKN